MKLVDVVHEEMFCGEPTKWKYSCFTNRFELFDKNGKHLNAFGFDERTDKAKNVEVLEVKKSGFQSNRCFVGFPVTHIKLDYIGNEKDFEIINDGLKFGGVNYDD